MSKQNENSPLSPTVTKVLDEYVAALRLDQEIEIEAINRLDTLLRRGRLPKPEDIDLALSPPNEDEVS